MKQKAKILFLLLTLAIAIYLLYLALTSSQAPRIGEIQPTSCTRIVSLAPSTTEILFALGLGDKVIGVSEFCNYPEQAKNLPRMGGLMNPNYEAIVAAKPDLIIVFDDMTESENKFKALGIETLTVKHDTMEEILDSVQTIGKHCGKEEQARQIVGDIMNKMNAIEAGNKIQNPPKVLVCLGHDYSPDPSAKPQNIHIAGNDGFYSKMIKLAGGQNAYTGSIPFPAVGYESVISMNPEIIIDIVSAGQDQADSQTITNQWRNLSRVEAVKNNRIYIFSENYTAIPGPRFILTLEKIARTINPDIRLEENEQKGN